MRLGCVLLSTVLGSLQAASASEVWVRLVGENGPLGAPAYAVTVDDTLVGTGMLPAPQGPLPRELADLGPVATEQTFTIPDGLLHADSVVKIHLINDSWDPDTGADATLYVLGVSIDGVAADVAAGTIATPTGEPRPVYLTADGALTLGWSAAASFAAPKEGWTQVAATGAEPASGSAITTTPVTEAGAAVEDKVAEVPATPGASEPACAVTASIALTDFANGVASVTEKTAQELIGFLDDLSVEHCRLGVTGYSSPGGEPEINLAVSQTRADVVLEFIKGRKLPFASTEAVGRGETTEFGGGAENRRVVVSVGP